MFFYVPPLNPEVHPALDERIMCTSVSPQFYILPYIQVQCYPPLWQLHSDFGNFNTGVCLVMKMTTADINPDKGLSPQQIFCLSHGVLATARKMPIMAMSAV